MPRGLCSGDMAEWDGDPAIRVGASVKWGQTCSVLRGRDGFVAGSPRAGGRTCHSNVGEPRAHLLSLKDAKNSTKEKTRKPCDVASGTSQCKLSTTPNAERPEDKGQEERIPRNIFMSRSG